MTMSLAVLRDSLAADGPPAGLDLALESLWWAGHGDWERAHLCAQDGEGDPRCDWVHAYLHRVEGDAANAGYWYRRAGKAVASQPPETEWAEIVQGLLSPSR